MEEHTLESLDKLYKKDLVQIVLTLQNKLKSSNDEVLEEIRKLNVIFHKLESDISITKNTNSLLLKRVVDLGKCSVFKKRMLRTGWDTSQCQP